MSNLSIRRYRPDDRTMVVSLLARTLGWLPDDRHTRLFDWKHERNPFGTSPAWVAENEGTVIGFRAFLRWEFDGGAGDAPPVRAVRAVDTATAPEHRGAGVFNALTRRGLEDLAADGTAFVFNTPNSQSLPGYLKMGWEEAGTIPVFARPSSPASLARMARSRTPAELWSLPTDAGFDAAELLSDGGTIDALVDAQPRPPSVVLQTRRTSAYLAWRYAGFPPVAYRALAGGTSAADGLILFRLRRRGRSLEAVIGDVLVPDADGRRVAGLTKRVLRETGADYAVCCGKPSARSGYLPLPGAGPMLAWRSLTPAQLPRLSEWRFTLGDIELL